jgi:hypothetical protein
VLHSLSRTANHLFHHHHHHHHHLRLAQKFFIHILLIIIAFFSSSLTSHFLFFILWRIFGNNQNGAFTYTKDFFGKQIPQIRHISKKKLAIARFRQ